MLDCAELGLQAVYQRFLGDESRAELELAKLVEMSCIRCDTTQIASNSDLLPRTPATDTS